MMNFRFRFLRLLGGHGGDIWKMQVPDSELIQNSPSTTQI